MTAQALANVEPVQAPAPTNETAAVIQMIERVALNPDVDIDKMERLLQMQERILERNAKAAYITALADMQPKLPVITERGGIKNKDGEVQSKYALWEDINAAIGPILSAHGFALSFRTGLADDGKITVTGVLSHREGHQEETTMTLPHDSSGNKNAVQAVGSSTSYGKRYTTQALLNLTSRGEDDDGKAAGGPDTISPEQVETIEAKIKTVGADEPKFLTYLKVSRVADIPAKHFAKAVAALDKKAAAQ